MNKTQRFPASSPLPRSFNRSPSSSSSSSSSSKQTSSRTERPQERASNDMACGSPVFPLQELPLFSDYGFDPHIDHFQELFRGARRKPSKRDSRPLDAIRFKLQKPICNDRCKSKSKRTKWWKKALLFWKRRLANKDHIQRESFSKPILDMVSAM